MIVVAGDLLRLVTVNAQADDPAFGSTPADIGFALDGQGLRSAAWLAKEDAPVRLCSAVGSPDAPALTTALAARGIESAFAEINDASTGVLARVSTPQGRSSFVDLGAASHFSPDAVPAGVLEGASWLHLSGFWLYETDTRSVARRLINQAKDLKLGVSVDPGSVNHLRAASAEAFIEWTTGVDLIFPNLDETRVLVGASGPFIDFEALGGIYPQAAVKLGSMGAAYVGQSAREQVAASRVDVVDSAGVGDAFAAGFLLAWVGGANPSTALSQGNALAQQCLQQRGALP